MATLLFGGNWYTSRIALSFIEKIHHVGDPHLTPDGKVIMVFDAGGITTMPSGPPIVTKSCLVPQNDGKHPVHHHDLMGLPENGDRLDRIQLSPLDLPDLEPLVEYDHLPENRKDYKVYQPGMKFV